MGDYGRARMRPPWDRVAITDRRTDCNDMKRWLEERAQMLDGLRQRVSEFDKLVGGRIPQAVGRVGGTAELGETADAVGAMSSRSGEDQQIWTGRLVLFLRVMAALALIKGLFHWSRVCGIGTPVEFSFAAQTLPYQTATVFFAVIELVAAVGLWLATPWGAVVWLTAIVSMAVVEMMFPMIYGGNLFVVGIELILLVAYFVMAYLSAHERPN